MATSWRSLFADIYYGRSSRSHFRACYHGNRYFTLPPKADHRLFHDGVFAKQTNEITQPAVHHVLSRQRGLAIRPLYWRSLLTLRPVLTVTWPRRKQCRLPAIPRRTVATSCPIQVMHRCAAVYRRAIFISLRPSNQRQEFRLRKVKISHRQVRRDYQFQAISPRLSILISRFAAHHLNQRIRSSDATSGNKSTKR